MVKRDDLTQNERAAYQSMIAHGYDEEDAYEAALDGVDVETVREMGRVYKRDGLYKSYWPMP